MNLENVRVSFSDDPPDRAGWLLLYTEVNAEADEPWEQQVTVSLQSSDPADADDARSEAWLHLDRLGHGDEVVEEEIDVVES